MEKESAFFILGYIFIINYYWREYQGIKSLIYKTDDEYSMILMRGNDEVNESKLLSNYGEGIINLPNLPNGIYYLFFSSLGNKFHHQKIIVQR